jgi:hypothetical protein
MPAQHVTDNNVNQEDKTSLKERLIKVFRLAVNYVIQGTHTGIKRIVSRH